ncbi:hypothetical protein FDF26_15050 [Clostridium botulinum]|nr:hypothetical protein [Clostridium botulinum]
MQYERFKLSELGELKRGKSKHRPRNDEKLFGGEYPFIQTGEIKSAEWKIDSFQLTYNEFGLSQSRLWPKETLCITIAANIAETAILDFPACFPDSVIGFIPDKNKANVYYVDYVLRNYKNKLIKSASQTAQKNINLQTFEREELLFPNIQKQNEIVGKIIPYEEKIRNNNSKIKVLDKYSQLLFYKWFIDFNFPDKNGNDYKDNGGEMKEVDGKLIPVGWSYKEVPEVCSIIDCLHAEKPKRLNENNTNILLQLFNIKEYGLLDLTEKYCITDEDYDLWTSRIEVSTGDILITNAGRVGAMAQVPKECKCAIGRNITAIRPISVPPTYVYLYLNSEDCARQIKKNTDKGSFFGSLNVRGIKQLKILMGEESIIEKFEDKMREVRKKIEMLNIENQKLIEIRDLLIKKLIK